MGQYSKLIVAVLGIGILVAKQAGVDVCATDTSAIGGVLASQYTTVLIGMATAAGVWKFQNK